MHRPAPRRRPQEDRGIYRNEVRHFDDQVVQYLTDTEARLVGIAGSSTTCWEVVALHHSWTQATRDGTQENRKRWDRRSSASSRGCGPAGSAAEGAPW